MSVGDWNKLGAKQRGKIMTVDPATRRIEVALKDGAMIQVSIWEIPTAFRWPKVDEIWTVCREGGYWLLGERVTDTEEIVSLEKVPANTVRLDDLKGKMTDNRDVVVTDESLAAEGDAPIWNDTQKKWIPGPVGGSSPVWAIAGPLRTNQNYVNTDNWTLPLDAPAGQTQGAGAGLGDIFGDSGGWTYTKVEVSDSRVSIARPPVAGWYAFGCTTTVVADVADGTDVELWVYTVASASAAPIYSQFSSSRTYKAPGNTATRLHASGLAYVNPAGSTFSNAFGFAAYVDFEGIPTTVKWGNNAFWTVPTLWAYKVA